MTDFQKSLTRFLYVALALVAVIGVWALLSCPAGKRPGPCSMMSARGYGGGVTATGTCVVRTKPELAEVTIGVRQSSSSAKAAKNYIKSTIRKMVKVLKDGGVATKDITTQDFRLESVWASGPGWQVKKWNGQEFLRVRIRNLDKVGELMDQTVKVGANRVSGVRYTVDDVNKLRAQGRVKAAKVAREKAQQLADTLGGRLGKLAACGESYPDDYANYGSYDYPGRYYGYANVSAQANVQAGSAEPDSSSEELTIQPGDLTLTVVVTATYEVE